MADTTTTTPPPPTSTTTGGHLTKKQRKEQFEALSALQTQLDVSVSLAKSKVASWLSADGFSDDEDEKSATGKSVASGNSFMSSSELKARQPGLGLGAKFISHKDAMRHVPMNAFESKLKRQMTGGVVAAEIARLAAAAEGQLPDKYMEHKLMMAAKRKEMQEQVEDEEDSRTRNIGSVKKSGGGGGSTVAPKQPHNLPPKSVKAAISTPTPSTSASTQSPSNTKQKHAGKYQPAVHPAALKAPPSDSTSAAPAKPAQSMGASKKRPADFFSMYMDERAQKMAKKKKKAQGKVEPDDDD